PTSGKTRRAKQIVEYFESRIQSSHGNSAGNSASGAAARVHHITDAGLHISRSVYDLTSARAHTRSANASEKDARAAVMAAVKRVLGPRDVVVLDAAGGSYIKGWRY